MSLFSRFNYENEKLIIESDLTSVISPLIHVLFNENLNEPTNERSISLIIAEKLLLQNGHQNINFV